MLLATIYLFQGFDFLAFFRSLLSLDIFAHPYVTFIVNKTVRLIINDLACFIIIWAIFQSKKHLKLSVYVFLVEVLVLLPVYFWIKLSIEGDSEISSPLLSQIHRLIVNPTLMILLMISFAYQKYHHRLKSS
jgi:exosortase F-associated protein